MNKIDYFIFNINKLISVSSDDTLYSDSNESGSITYSDSDSLDSYNDSYYYEDSDDDYTWDDPLLNKIDTTLSLYLKNINDFNNMCIAFKLSEIEIDNIIKNKEFIIHLILKHHIGLYDYTKNGLYISKNNFKFMNAICDHNITFIDKFNEQITNFISFIINKELIIYD